MGWPYYICPTLVRVSMEYTDTLPRGIHGLTMLCMSNIGQSICGIRRHFVKLGIHGLAILCMSNVGQSIHGIHGYFAKG